MRRVLCINYLAGFCPSGPKCTDAHPRFELPGPADMDPKMGKKVDFSHTTGTAVTLPTPGCDYMPLLWRSRAQSFSLPQNAPGFTFLSFHLRASKLCNTLPLLQELKDQQVNELGKTFMPYTQSNYRMHPMVVMPTKNSEFTVIRRATADLIVSRLWTRSPASSVAKMATLPTNVPRYSKKIPYGGFSL